MCRLTNTAQIRYALVAWDSALLLAVIVTNIYPSESTNLLSRSLATIVLLGIIVYVAFLAFTPVIKFRSIWIVLGVFWFLTIPGTLLTFALGGNLRSGQPLVISILFGIIIVLSFIVAALAASVQKRIAKGEPGR